jgi:hypothetical protein
MKIQRGDALRRLAAEVRRPGASLEDEEGSSGEEVRREDLGDWKSRPPIIVAVFDPRCCVAA